MDETAQMTADKSLNLGTGLETFGPYVQVSIGSFLRSINRTLKGKKKLGPGKNRLKLQ